MLTIDIRPNTTRRKQNIARNVQLFDDVLGKDIGEQKIVSPEACTFYFLPDEEPTAEFDFKFRTEDPAILFDGVDIEDLKWRIVK